jgi:HEAT repeat protein
MRKHRRTAATALALAALAGGAFAQADSLGAAVALTRSADPEARYNGAEALASIRRPESETALAALLASDPDARVRQSAAGALGLLGNAAAAPGLIAALKDSAAPVRFAAVRSLGSLRARTAVGPLSALLNDPDASMRRTVAAELGLIGDPAAKDALKASLADADEGARLEASGALARMGDAGGRAAARAALGSNDALSRRRAAQALALGGDAPALAALDAAFAAERDGATKAAFGEARVQLRKRLGLKKAPAAGR